MPEVILTVKYTVSHFMFDYGVYKTECLDLIHQLKMFFIFISIIAVLQCVPTTNREALRAKLLDAQNVMQFDQTEFDRLWNLGMTNGNFKIW